MMKDREDDIMIPAGYTRVQYLQKNTARVYATLLNSKQSTDAFRIVFELDKVNLQARICGANTSSGSVSYMQLYINGTGALGYAAPGTTWGGLVGSGGLVTGKKMDVTLDYPNYRTVVNGVQSSMPAGSLSTGSHSFFLPAYGANTTGNTTTNTFEGKIFRFWYWRSGSLIRNIVPVRKGDKGYFYDAINGTIYSVTGGSLIVGPDY